MILFNPKFFKINKCKLEAVAYTEKKDLLKQLKTSLIQPVYSHFSIKLTKLYS